MGASFSDIETRLENLENLVNSLSASITNNKFYTDADIAGCRQDISDVTPTTYTKTAYIDDTEVVFNNVPSGNVTVYIEDANGSFLNYSIARMTDMITVSFDRPLEYTATITLSIL